MLSVVCFKLIAGGRAGRRLFRMQIGWATARDVFVEPLLERGSAGQSARNYAASQRLGFHDRDIRLAGNGK